MENIAPNLQDLCTADCDLNKNDRIFWIPAPASNYGLWAFCSALLSISCLEHLLTTTMLNNFISDVRLVSEDGMRKGADCGPKKYLFRN